MLGKSPVYAKSIQNLAPKALPHHLAMVIQVQCLESLPYTILLQPGRKKKTLSVKKKKVTSWGFKCLLWTPLLDSCCNSFKGAAEQHAGFQIPPALWIVPVTWWNACYMHFCSSRNWKISIARTGHKIFKLQSTVTTQTKPSRARSYSSLVNNTCQTLRPDFRDNSAFALPYFFFSISSIQVLQITSKLSTVQRTQLRPCPRQLKI